MSTQIGTAFELTGTRTGGGNWATGDSWETRTYSVKFDDCLASSIDARNANGVPLFGEQLVAFPNPGYGLVVLEKDIRPDPDDQSVWIVTATFRVPKATDMLPQPNSTVHKWQIVKSAQPYPTEVPVYKDLNDKLVVNILGEEITPTPTRVIYDQQLNIAFMTDLVDQVNIDACKGSINGSTLNFMIGGATVNYNAGTLLFNGWPLQEQYDGNGVLTVSQQYQFLYRSDGWVAEFPNKSTGVLKTGGVLGAGGTNNNYDHINGYDGPSDGHYLNASGGIAAQGSIITTSSFNFYQTASFSTLLAGLF